MDPPLYKGHLIITDLHEKVKFIFKVDDPGRRQLD
jgi:hypothetical protein